MASSGNMTTDSHQGRSLKFTWKEKSQSVTNNSTTITWELVGAGSASGYVKCGGFYVKIDGDIKVDVSTSTRKEVYNGTVVASGTTTIKHDSNGSKSFKVIINAGIYEYERNSKTEETFTLNKIARASTITSVSNVTLGKKCNVKWTPASTSFYYKLKFKLDGWSKTIEVGKPGVTSEYTYSDYTIPTSVASYITDGTTGTMTVYLYTYSNSTYETQIGSATSKTFTVTVPSTTVPNITSFEVTPVNTNETVKNWGVFLKGITKAKVSCNAEGVSGSTIDKYTISGGYSITRTTMPYTGSVITKSGNIIFKCQVTDSRGLKSDTSETTINVIDYYSPSISDVIIARSEQDPTKVTAKVVYNFASVDGKNNATAKLLYRKTSDSNFTEYGIISNGIEEVLNVSFEDTASYLFTVEVTDSLGSVDKEERMVSTMKVIMDFRDGGQGLGIGKIAESDKLEVGFESDFFEDSTFKKDVQIDGTLTASNLGRDVFAGMDLIVDKGILSNTGEHTVYFYVLKPFNLVYFRMYIAGLTAEVAAGTSKVLLCKVAEKFKPAAHTALSAYCVRGCDVRIGTDCGIYCMPQNGLGSAADVYISGIYSLHTNSSLYQGVN